MKPKRSARDTGEQKTLLDLLTALQAELEACEGGDAIVEALDDAYGSLNVNRSDKWLKQVLYANKVYIQYQETSARYEKLRAANTK